MKCIDCKRAGQFECSECGSFFCGEHEEIYGGNCPYCAPRLVPIKKEKKK